MAEHHSVKVRTAGLLLVARPLRDTSWWHRRKAERACRRTVGHCWHPDGFVDWWCCECSAETDGTPPQWCRYCRNTSGERSTVPPPPESWGVREVDGG